MTKFNVLYRPSKHNGKTNVSGATLNYEIYQPEEGFGNMREGASFAGFKARKVDGSGYRAFRFDRVVAMVPAK